MALFPSDLEDLARAMRFEAASLSSWTKPGSGSVSINRVRDAERKINAWAGAIERLAKEAME